MKALFAALALGMPLAAAAQAASTPQEQGHHAWMYERYC